MHVHSSSGADACFGCKMAYMREHRSLAVTYAGGREVFHDEPSVRVREKQAVADARRGGIEPERA